MMSLIVLIAMVIGIIALTIYNIRVSRGRLKRVVKAVCIVLGSAVVLAAGVGVVGYHNSVIDSEKFVAHSGFLGFNYKRTQEGYYIFSHPQLLSSPEYIAVPEGDASLPALTGLFSEVCIYTEDNKSYEDIQLSDGRYELWDDVVKITPEYLLLAFLIILEILAGLMIFDLVVVVLILKSRAETENERENQNREEE